MALINCPECGHEISTAAVACPGCGRPISGMPAPAVVEPVIVAKRPHPREGFPLWAIVPLTILGVTLLLILFYALGRNDDLAESNLNVNVNTRRASTSSRSDSDRSSTDSYTTTVPPSSSTTVVEPPPASSSSVPQTVTVPGTSVNTPPERGRVVIDAKIASRTGTPTAVRNEKFYLLDKDLESILSDADLEPIEGNTMANSFGLAVMFPDRYGSFHRAAMAAIRPHIKYSGTTDGSGKAQLSNIEPDSYYLFGITKTGKGFAMWSNPVSIRAGENVLNLSPQPVTEMNNYSE
jgi:hypothetical protein